LFTVLLKVRPLSHTICKGLGTMSIGFEYYDFNVWQDEERRHASEDEVKEHVHFEIAEDGTCKVWCSEGFTITRR